MGTAGGGVAGLGLGVRVYLGVTPYMKTNMENGATP